MPESWLELSSVSEPEAADAVAEVFGRWGRGVAIDQPVMDAPDGDGGWIDPIRNVVVKTYIPVDEEAEEKRRLLEEAAWHLGRLRHVEPLQTRVIAEEDWANAWKRFFFPHRVGKRLVIVPSWRRRARGPDDLVIRLDPGMAFGTGLHPDDSDVPGAAGGATSGLATACSTSAAARRSSRSPPPASAPSASRRWTSTPSRWRSLQENARRNKVVRRIGVRKATVEPGVPVRGAPFDVVAANISAFVLKNAANGLASATKPGAPAILSGILVSGADDVRATYEAAGWRYVETRTEGDWIAMVVRRPEA